MKLRHIWKIKYTAIFVDFVKSISPIIYVVDKVLNSALAFAHFRRNLLPFDLKLLLRITVF